MNTKRNPIGLENFILFTQDVDQLCQKNHPLMDSRLLHLVSQAFGYKTVTLSHYDRSGFRGVEGTGLFNGSGAQEQYRNFQKKDPFAAHISRTCKTSPATHTLQSSRVFHHQYFGNDYYHFLYRFGVSWALSMPIGEYRLTVYKENDEADFGNDERTAMQLLSILLKDRHVAQKASQTSETLQHIQSKILDSIHVGVICANQDMQIYSCNQTARDFLRQWHHHEDSQHTFDQLHRSICEHGRQLHGVHANRVWELMHHTLILERMEGECGQDDLYILSIFPQKHPNWTLSSSKMLNQYGLSARELETCQLLMEGMTYQQAASALYISINTVRTHIKNVYKKTGVRNLRQLIQLFGN